jgi:hypothetical protein
MFGWGMFVVGQFAEDRAVLHRYDILNTHQKMKSSGFMGNRGVISVSAVDVLTVRLSG